MPNWWVKKGGRDEGPFSLDEMKRLFAEKQLSLMDQVRAEGATSWLQVFEVEEIVGGTSDRRVSDRRVEERRKRPRPVWVALARQGEDPQSPYLQKGPFTTEEVHSLLHKGELRYGDFIWRKEMKAWQKISEVFKEDRKAIELPPPELDVDAVIKSVDDKLKAAPPLEPQVLERQEPIKEQVPEDATQVLTPEQISHDVLDATEILKVDLGPSAKPEVQPAPAELSVSRWNMSSAPLPKEEKTGQTDSVPVETTPAAPPPPSRDRTQSVRIEPLDTDRKKRPSRRADTHSVMGVFLQFFLFFVMILALLGVTLEMSPEIKTFVFKALRGERFKKAKPKGSIPSELEVVKKPEPKAPVETAAKTEPTPKAEPAPKPKAPEPELRKPPTFLRLVFKGGESGLLEVISDGSSHFGIDVQIFGVPGQTLGDQNFYEFSLKRTAPTVEFKAKGISQGMYRVTVRSGELLKSFDVAHAPQPKEFSKKLLKRKKQMAFFQLQEKFRLVGFIRDLQALVEGDGKAASQWKKSLKGLKKKLADEAAMKQVKRKIYPEIWLKLKSAQDELSGVLESEKNEPVPKEILAGMDRLRSEIRGLSLYR